MAQFWHQSVIVTIALEVTVMDFILLPMKDVFLYHFLSIFTALLVYVAKFKKIGRYAFSTFVSA